MGEQDPTKIPKEQTMRPEFLRQRELSEFSDYGVHALDRWIESLHPDTNVAELLCLLDARTLEPNRLLESMGRLNQQFRWAAEEQHLTQPGEFHL